MPPRAHSAQFLFEARQAEAAERTERRLAQVLASSAADGQPERLAAAMRHGTLEGGKRFRAFLVLESARLFGVEPEAALDVAAALECVHAYSLIHDDLPAMDNDELRRGRPTVWKAYDDWTAVLAGDALLTLAFEIVGTCGALAADRKVSLITGLARGAGREGMVGGQVIDLKAEKLGLPMSPTLDHILRLQAMKTGALIRFACEAGAIMAGAGGAQKQALARYGAALGLAFQISDDLLDVEGQAGVVGKAVGKDASLGKATLVSLLGAGKARTRLNTVVADAIAALALFGPLADPLRGAAEFMRTRQK